MDAISDVRRTIKVGDEHKVLRRMTVRDVASVATGVASKRPIGDGGMLKRQWNTDHRKLFGTWPTCTPSGDTFRANYSSAAGRHHISERRSGAAPVCDVETGASRLWSKHPRSYSFQVQPTRHWESRYRQSRGPELHAPVGPR